MSMSVQPVAVDLWEWISSSFGITMQPKTAHKPRSQLTNFVKQNTTGAVLEGSEMGSDSSNDTAAQHESGGAQNREHAEIAHIRKNRPSLGVEDLPEVEQLGETIADTVSEMVYQYASEAAVKRVYICGSFARGDATAVISDLDVRVVLDQGLDLFVLESVQEELKNEVGFDIIPDECGFLDPLIDTEDPEDTPSVLIWESELHV